MGASRQIKRNQVKSAYKKFSVSWRNEKAYQRFLLSSGDTPPEDAAVLKQRPTFDKWLKMVRTLETARKTTPAEVNDFSNESMNLEWDDEKHSK